MRAAGATEEQIAATCNHAQQQSTFEVLEANWPALQWFLEVDDLFRYEGGVCLGLDVLAIQANAQMSGQEVVPADYKKLRLLGQMAASELNKKIKK